MSIRALERNPITPEPSEADPRLNPIGYLITGDVGPGEYRWFPDDRLALRWYVERELLGGSLRVALPELRARVATMLDWAERRNAGLGVMAATLNAVTKPAAQVLWCGPFEELVSGETEMARQVCAEYWELKEGRDEFELDGEATEPEAQTPIPPEELGAFIEHLRSGY
jgi:hypothetical protein